MERIWIQRMRLRHVVIGKPFRKSKRVYPIFYSVTDDPGYKESDTRLPLIFECVDDGLREFALGLTLSTGLFALPFLYKVEDTVLA